MAKYEITLIFDKGNKTVAEKFKKELETLKVIILKDEDWGVKPLAYLIKGHKEARYLFLEIETDALTIKTIESKLKLDEELLRYLLVRI